MRLKSLLFRSLGQRTQVPMPVLAVPGMGLILLGIIVFLAPAIFIFLIATTLILLGALLLFLAFRMKPQQMTPQPRKTRIRVVEDDETW